MSKWERDEILDEKSEKTSSASVAVKEVEVKDNVSTEITSDIIKRAENVMLSKNFHSNESNKANTSESLSSVIKKIDADKKYESFQVTAALNSGTRSIELQRDDHHHHNKERKRSDEPSSSTLR